MSNVTKYGMAIIMSGASGTGKSTVLKNLRALLPDMCFSVSCTTRPPRPGEEEGRDYFFISRDDFEMLLKEEAFIEHAQVHGQYYGTLRTQILDPVARGKTVLLDIDVQGAEQIRRCAESDDFLRRCCCWVFMAPPSFSELERRLRGRHTDSEEVIKRRLQNAHGELQCWNKYDAVIVNDDAPKTAEKLLTLINAFSMRTAAYKEAPYDAE